MFNQSRPKTIAQKIKRCITVILLAPSIFAVNNLNFVWMQFKTTLPHLAAPLSFWQLIARLGFVKVR